MNEIDQYLAGVTGWQQKMLLAWQRLILELVPNAEQVIYYGVPCFKVDGQAVGGFAAYKNHCAYFPFSGQTLVTLKTQVAEFKCTSGSLHVTEAQVLSKPMIDTLLQARAQEIAEGYGRRKKK